VSPVNKHCHHCLAGEGKRPPKAMGRKTLKESQGGKGLYKCIETNPSRGENPEDKSWSSRMGVGHRVSNPLLEKTYFAMKSQSSIAGWITAK
jgi:hypothetical protein